MGPEIFFSTEKSADYTVIHALHVISFHRCQSYKLVVICH